MQSAGPVALAVSGVIRTGSAGALREEEHLLLFSASFCRKCQHSLETSSHSCNVPLVCCASPVRRYCLSSGVTNSIWGFASSAPSEALSPYFAKVYCSLHWFVKCRLQDTGHCLLDEGVMAFLGPWQGVPVGAVCGEGSVLHSS